MRQFGTPATAFGLAGHGRFTLGAAGFHGEIMARRKAGVQSKANCCATRWRLSCQRGEAGAIFVIRWRLAKHAGAVYFLLLQSLTGKLNS